MPDVPHWLEMSYAQVTDLVAFLGMYLRYLRMHVVTSQQRNTLIYVSQTMQGRLLSQLEARNTRIAISMSYAEVATLKTLLKDIKPMLEQMPSSLEQERKFRSLWELQQLLAPL